MHEAAILLIAAVCCLLCFNCGEHPALTRTKSQASIQIVTDETAAYGNAAVPYLTPF